MFAQTYVLSGWRAHARAHVYRLEQNTTSWWGPRVITTCHVSQLQCEDPEWLGDWTTKTCRNVLSVVRQVVLLLVTMRLLAECCPDHTWRRCLIMFEMWSKSPRQYLFCFLLDEPTITLMFYIYFMTHSKWASDTNVYNDFHWQTVKDLC